MIWDRRRQKRNLLENFVFIQIEKDEGGRVLNVSEGGLSFEVFSPVPQNGPVHFWFSFNLRERIEAFGELAWTDAARKVGGLRFLNLSLQNREQIGAWVKQVSTDESPGRELVSSVIPTLEVSSSQASEPSASMTAISNGRFSNAVPLHDNLGSETPESEVHALRHSFGAARLVPLERFLTATRRRFILGVLLGILVSAIVAIPAFKYFSHRGQIPALKATPSPTDVGKPDAQAGAPGMVSSSEAARAPLTASAAGKTPQSGALGYHPDGLFGSALTQPHLQSSQRSSVSQLTVKSAQPQSDNTKNSKKIAVTPQQLWSSVQAGNAKAAVALADLYIRGDGVPVNCNQARVLLLAASEKSNADAIRKLQELDKTGCSEP